VVPPTEQAFDTRAYITQKGGLYTIQKGMTLEHRGHTIAAGKTLFDTCSEVNLLSKEDADANHILYGPCPTTIHTSMGSAGGVMGQVVGPVFCVLNKGTLHECKMATQEGVTFLVVQGVADLYDVLLSTHVARDWGARADPVLNEL